LIFFHHGFCVQSIHILHDAIGILNRSDAGIVGDDDKGMFKYCGHYLDIYH
jgi:hypothetical protein